MTLNDYSRFLYMLILAMDANFRLKNGMNSTYARDPSLGPGWAYFVKDEPYFEHLRNYISEADVSDNHPRRWLWS